MDLGLKKCVCLNRRVFIAKFDCAQDEDEKDVCCIGKSVDRNCVLSFDQKFHNQLTEIFDSFHLTELFFPNLTWPNLT